MGKKLAIKGHPTRGKEIIELLEMMGGDNKWLYDGSDGVVYFIEKNDKYITYCGKECIKNTGEYIIYELEEFLEKYPFKIGDKVIDKADGCPGIVNEMKWDEDVSDMKYFVAFGNDIDFGWFANDSIEFCKETDTVKPVTNKSERTHEDVIFDSIIWHLRNSVNNGKQNLSGGECEDYFREVVKKNNENKMSDCKKCGLGFGSVRCFDKDCPHNAPKSYAVGLKDGKVIECGVNKEIVMNENNREVINMTKETFTPAPDITANITDKNNCDIACPDGYEFYDENGNLIGNKVKMRPKKPKYPTTYEECWEVRFEVDGETTLEEFHNVSGYYSGPLGALQKLLCCRDAYWKIAGEEMGLDGHWEPDWSSFSEGSYPTITKCNGMIVKTSIYTHDCPFAFPSAEMRDAFYENFKDLFEQCKELL